MTEHYLQRAQIGAVFEQMRRKRVPQHMRSNVGRNARFSRTAFDYLPNALP
jgi:hypothetical protein